MFAANVVDAVQDLPIVGDLANGVINAVGDVADPVVGLISDLLSLGG